MVRRLVVEFGEFKKVIRLSTGVAYKVPTRDIIEKGFRGEELDQYPRWEEPTNIFRQAKQLLQDKPVLEMNEEELQIVNTATMPLLRLPLFSDRSINEGLEELAKMADGID